MDKLRFIFLKLMLVFIFNNQVAAQNNTTLHNIDVTFLSGETFAWNELITSNTAAQKLTVVKFWSAWTATHCQPCNLKLKHLANKNEQEWKKNPNIELLTVCVDKVLNHIQLYLDERQLDFEVIVDSEATLQKYLGVHAVPSVLVIDQTGTIVYNSANTSLSLESFLNP